ncbi:retention module-containing protein, partial [Desulfopila aestuarii]
MTQSGKVQAISGQVTARTPEGQVRELHVGDLVYENEIIETSAGATLSIIQPDGNLLALDANEQLLLDESVNGTIDPTDANVQEVAELQQAIVEAIANDQNIDDLLEETAAGQETNAGPAGGDAYDFRAGYHAGDTSAGSVGAYLLDSENARTEYVYDQYVGDEPDAEAVIEPPVQEENLPPTIEVTGATIVEGEAEAGTVAATFVVADADGDVLSVDFTPGTNEEGYYEIVGGEVVLTEAGADHVNEGGELPDVQLTVTDGQDSASDSASVTIDTNSPPFAEDDTASVTEDSTISGSVADNDYDIDGTIVSYTLNGETPEGITFDPKTGAYTFDASSYDSLAEGETQTFNIEYTVTDDQGATDTATLAITVTGTNDAPIANDDTLSATEDTPVTYTAAQLLGNDSDIDGP